MLRQYVVVHRSPAWWQIAAAGLAAARAAGDRDGEGAMLHSLGALQLVTGDVTAAVESLSEAADRYGEAGFRRGAAALLCNLAMAHDDRGDSRLAADLFTRGIAELRALGLVAVSGPALLGLSMSWRNLGELDAAQQHAEEALEVTTDDLIRRLALVNRAAALRLKGELALADADMTEATTGDALPMPVGFEVALLKLGLGRFDEAEQWARRSAADGHRVGSAWHEAGALVALGQIRLRRCDLDGAAPEFRAAHAIALRQGYRAVAAEALLGLGAVAFGRTELVRARALGLRTLELAARLEYRILECRAQQLLAEIGYAAGSSAEAARHAAAASALRTATGYRPPPLGRPRAGAA